MAARYRQIDSITDLTRGLYRRVYGNFITGRRICGVSLEAEAWFWRINSIVDDFGNIFADAILLRNATVGRRANITVDQVSAWVIELVTIKLVSRYEADGETYLHVNDFEYRQPAGKNGKRVQRHPLFQVNPGESSGHASKVKSRKFSEFRASGASKNRTKKKNGESIVTTDDSTTCDDGVNPGESSASSASQHQHHTHTHKQQQQRDAKASAADSLREGILEALTAAGIAEPSRSRCAKIPGLTPIGVLIIAEQFEKDAKIKNKPGLIIQKLLNGYAGPKLVSPKDLARLVNAGIVRCICGTELPKGCRATQNAGGLQFRRKDDQSVLFSWSPEQLTPNVIELKMNGREA